MADERKTEVHKRQSSKNQEFGSIYLRHSGIDVRKGGKKLKNGNK